MDAMDGWDSEEETNAAGVKEGGAGAEGDVVAGADAT